MTRSELLELISNGENSGVEFKRDDVRSEQLAKELAALLNLQGGMLILGVDDDGTITGIQRTNLEHWVMDTVFGRKLHPMVLPFYEEIIVDENRRVAVISVTQGASKPYVVRHNDREEIYVRVGSSSRLATREQQARLFAIGGMLSTDLLPVSGSTFHDLNKQRLEDYLLNIVREDETPESNETWIQRLCGLGLMTDRANDTPVCTVSGMVLFGLKPRRFLPQAGVRWMAFSGTDKDYSALDDQLLDGALVSQGRELPNTGREVVEKGLIERIVDVMRPFVSQDSDYVDETLQRRHHWHYPIEAIREAVVNALAHRDWTRHEEIEIVSYSNRLEICSPGSLPNTMTVEKMIAGQRSQRNLHIVNVLRDYGYVEDRGMGIRKKIFPLLRKENGVEPKIQASEDRLVVTMGRAYLNRGTVVKMRTNQHSVPDGSLAYFLKKYEQRTFHLLTDAGETMVAPWEIIFPYPPVEQFRPMRLWMPYGIWTERNGARVLYSRDYCPLWRILPGGQVERESPWTEIDFVGEAKTLWSPAEPPWTNSKIKLEIENLMHEMAIPNEMPILMDVLPVLIRGDADRIVDAVKFLAPTGSGFPHFPR